MYFISDSVFWKLWQSTDSGYVHIVYSLSYDFFIAFLDPKGNNTVIGTLATQYIRNIE